MFGNTGTGMNSQGRTINRQNNIGNLSKRTETSINWDNRLINNVWAQENREATRPYFI